MAHVDALGVVLLCLAGLVASVVAAVAGFGGAAVLLPVLVLVFGTRDAVPILTLAQLFGNGSRVWLNRKEIDWRVVWWYSLGAIPLSFIGGLMFAAAPVEWLTRGIGGFLIAMVGYRRVFKGSYPRLSAPAFVFVGAGASFLSALVGMAGLVTAPFFLAFGLVKGAYIGTEAAATVVTHVFKSAAYASVSLLSPTVVLTGILLAPVMFAGSWIGKRVVDRLSDRAFIAVIELVMVSAGAWLILKG